MRVAKALRESGDEEVLALFGAGPEPDLDAAFDHEACAAVTKIAERPARAGSWALDLYTEVIRRGWSPFPIPGAGTRAAAADLEEVGVTG